MSEERRINDRHVEETSREAVEIERKVSAAAASVFPHVRD
jgi:hypothetical protein